MCSTALLSEQTRAAHWLFAGCKAVAVLNSKQQTPQVTSACGAQDGDDEVQKYGMSFWASAHQCNMAQIQDFEAITCSKRAYDLGPEELWALQGQHPA